MKSTSSPLPRIIVLAAGFSKRLGRPKASVRIHGLTLLQRLHRVLAPLSQHAICVVLPPCSPLRRPARSAGWHCIDNPDRARGLSSSVARAIGQCAQAPALLFIPIDLAELETADLRRLLRHWSAHRRCIVARGVEGRAVIPLILPKRLFGLSRQLRGDSGLKDLIAAHGPGEIRLVRMDSAARDIDTPADLAAARRRFRRP